jgi:hypothetical protein
MHCLWRLPRKLQPTPPPSAGAGAAPATAALLLAGALWLSLSASASAAATSSFLAESVTHDIRIEDQFALATTTIHWEAEPGHKLPLVLEPAVLTGIRYPSNCLKLVTAPPGAHYAQELLAQRKGTFTIELRYQLPVTKKEAATGLAIPVQYGLVNRLKLTVVNLDVDVSSPQAVSIQRSASGSNTVASIVLSPVNEPWVTWKPRSRDVKHEKPVFYAEIPQLYVPSAGVIEGLHYLSIRPAQGELSELLLDVPAGATITDVAAQGVRAALSSSGGEGRGEEAAASSRPSTPSLVSLWRFDPEARKLRVTLNPPQSRPFALRVRSQVATGPLPFEQSVGLLSVVGAASQIGLLGIATGSEVQLDSVNAPACSPINLEDFPAELVASLQSQVPGLTVRRAFRYAGTNAVASLKASPVEPDIVVENQATLSLGEDRTVLASEALVNISRAGIFRLSFVLPAGFDVESISGSALSHWTESKTDAGRVITLHLNGKTEGQQKFSLSLAGPGVKATRAWTVPQWVVREASKQRGTLLLVPEQGLRLQVAARDGVAQLDPQKSGIKQKGVLAFNLLQSPWNLALDIEQVDPWIQVTTLQHATVNEAQVKIAANLQYQIDNTGLKSFRVFLRTNAESVHFQGEQLADFLPVAHSATNGLQLWEVKLHRRVIGPYLLQATYQTLIPEQAPQTALRGLQAVGVNLQRGFVTVQSAGRLQLRADAPPAALQPTEWQSIPRALQQGLPTTAANFSYRLVEEGFELPLKLERHEAAKLLPARINNITFNSVISDDGVMLTQVRLEMLPGDKRLLNLTLPKDSNFWFAFVNQNGVWPWREQDRLLIPLEQQAGGGKAIPVELFYTSHIGAPDLHSLNLELLAPKFDLPLENITWRVSLSDKWQLKKWSGSLQFQQEEVAVQSAAFDLQGYLQNEALLQRERTRVAENLLAAGNSALEKGEPQMARRSFQAAYGLSAHDAAFNEDARVQLHNIKLQEALVGLNVRQAATTGDPATLGAKLRDLRNRKELNYTQQDAKDIIDRNTADENSAFMRLAERLIQQQDAAVSSPAALRASLPEQGRVLTFKRAVLVDALIGTPDDLKLGLRLTPAKSLSATSRLLILAVTLFFLTAATLCVRPFRRPVPEPS